MRATSLDRFDDAESHLAAAASFHTTMDAQPWLARTLYEQARLALRRGQPADTATDSAVRIAATLGMPALRNDLDALFKPNGQ